MNEISIYPPGCKDIQIELANDELIRRLKKIQQAFQNLDQSADEKYKELACFLGSEFFLEHHHEDIQLLVACCLADIFRIYAPDSPFSDPNNLKNIFMFLANQLRGLKDSSNAAFKRYFYLLENLECVKTFLICQELDDSQEIIVNLFENVFKITNDRTSPRVRPLLFELLHPLLNDADQISTKVLDIIFARIIEPAKSNNKEAYTLAVNLLKRGSQHFEYLVQNHLNSILLTSRSNVSHNLTISNGLTDSSSHVNESANSDEMSLLNNSLNEIAGQSSEAAKEAGVYGAGGSSQFITDKLCLIIYELNTIRPALLELVMPQLEYKLKSNDHKERREYTRLLSKMFSEKDSNLATKVPQLWEAYLERFADMNEDIRKICIQHICDFLVQQVSSVSQLASNISINNVSTSHLHHPSTTSSSSQILEQIIEQIKSRSLDPDEALRYEVVQEILKAIKLDTNLITSDLLSILQKRTLDVKIKIRKAALQGLAQLYKKVHAKNNHRKIVRLHNWIPSTIMKIYFQDSIEDKLMVERLLNSCIVPYSLGPREKMGQLYYAFSTFDDYSILSLIEIMKNRVLLYQLMKSIIELNENPSKSPESAAKLQSEISQVSAHLLDTAKGQEFMKILLNLFKTNLNLKGYFKNFVNVTCSCTKTMQLIQLIFTNLNSLNTTQMGMGKRLIERMSSLIIDKECLESLIDLVEYKIKQKLTPEQRRMIMKRKNNGETIKTKKGRPRKQKDSDTDNECEESSSDEELIGDEGSVDEMKMTETEEDDDDGDYDDNATRTTEASTQDSDSFKEMLKHIDDDGEKGLKLINTILTIHQNYGFANPITYEKLFVFVNSRKAHIVSSTSKMLSHHFSPTVRATFTKEEQASFKKTNVKYQEKLKYLVKSGKAKQVKYALYLIANNLEKEDSEEILYDLYHDLLREAEAKNSKKFITSLVGLGHLTLLIPHLVAKEMKEFIVNTIVKGLLFTPVTQPLNISANELSTTHVTAQKRKNNLKLAGKWCENEDELPFNTQARIESIKLLTRWCLSLKSECQNITTSLKLLTKIIKENSLDSTTPNENSETHENKSMIQVSEAERSRLRSVCGNQLIKLAQESSFKPLITAEFFHVVARLIIDPVTNIRDILIKKVSKGLQSTRLPIYYMSMFALSGLDTNRERRVKIKKIYSTLITRIRLNDAKNQKKQMEANLPRTRILPEMCLPYAVSLLAHNLHIDSLKEDNKVKQVKECMAVILDPLIEKPDSYQVAYIKKILNKIKISDDGLSAAAMTAVSNSSNQSAAMNKSAIHNLYSLNKKLCLICEIFLFHMHSKSTTYLTAKEYEFDVKLPTGFYAMRDINSESGIRIDRFNSDDKMESSNSKDNDSSKKSSTQEDTATEIDLDKENFSEKPKKPVSRIEIVSKKRPSTNDSQENINLNNSKELKSPEKQKDTPKGSPPSKRNKLNDSRNTEATPIRKSLRGKKTPEVLNESTDKEREEKDEIIKEESEEDKSEEEATEPVSTRKSGRKTAAAADSKTSAKKGTVTKSGKKKSPEVKHMPVRSTRSTRSSAK